MTGIQLPWNPYRILLTRMPVEHLLLLAADFDTGWASLQGKRCSLFASTRGEYEPDRVVLTTPKLIIGLSKQAVREAFGFLDPMLPQVLSAWRADLAENPRDHDLIVEGRRLRANSLPPEFSAWVLDQKLEVWS